MQYPRYFIFCEGCLYEATAEQYRSIVNRIIFEPGSNERAFWARIYETRQKVRGLIVDTSEEALKIYELMLD